MNLLSYSAYIRSTRRLASHSQHLSRHLCQRRRIASHQMIQPRVFPTSGFTILEPAEKLEEELLPDYVAERFYPVRIGEVFKSRYQVVTKLGFGSASTVYCRDLRNEQYLVLKVHVRTRRILPEVRISEHLKSIQANIDAGQKYVQLILDSFEISGPHGVHPCLLYKPAGIDIRDYTHCLEGDFLPQGVLRPALRFILIALDYLHNNSVIHTDVQPNNVLLGIEDESILAGMEEDEISDPSPRKQLSDRTIYITRGMPLTSGEPILADLGEARIATKKQTGLIMPSVYRAPEVMLNMDWDNKVDIWAVGQMAWTLFEQGHLFENRNLENDTDHARRFAEMISLLGPPPLEFLKRNEESLKFWDSSGNWRGMVEIPRQSLEDRESRLEGKAKVLFLQFLRKALRWLPEERPTANELLFDEWLRGGDY